jgi:hypothetical protein
MTNAHLLYMMTNTYLRYHAHFFLERNVFHKKLEKIKQNILCLKIFFVYYEITRKNIVELGRSEMTICPNCFTCWIPKGTNTHSYVMRMHFCNFTRALPDLVLSSVDTCKYIWHQLKLT